MGSISSIRFSLNSFVLFVSPRYQPQGRGGGGGGVQFAVAINVPSDQCGDAFSQNFLSGENADTVKKALKDNNLYKGEQLVAATPKGSGQTNAVHSERALLMCEDSSDAVTPMKDLLNKNKGGCVVFYTYNSPCLKLCLNQAKDDEIRQGRDKKIEKKRPNIPPLVQKCILKSLGVLTNHGGPKAFVFSRVYDEDLGSATLAAALKVVAEKVPLYKCDAGSCFKCLSNGQIIDECLNVKV